MKRKFLEDMGLTKEQVDSVMDENGKDVNAAKADLESVKKERDQAKEQLSDRDKQLEDLKASSGDNETLKKQIADLQEANKQKDKDHAEEIKNLKLDAAIRAALGDSAQDADLVAGLIDRSKLLLSDDGKVTGLDEQVKTLKENKAFLFKEEGGKGGGNNPPGFHPVGARRQDGGNNPPKNEGQQIDMRAAIAAQLKSSMGNQ